MAPLTNLMLEDKEEADRIRKAVLDYIKARWPSKDCKICGANAWSVAGRVDLDGVGLTAGAYLRFPTALVICSNCSNTVFLNLMIAGIVKGRP